jgi:hypothetical protein
MGPRSGRSTPKKAGLKIETSLPEVAVTQPMTSSPRVSAIRAPVACQKRYS